MNNNGENGSNTLGQWVAILWKHKWLGIAFMALVVSAAILYTRRQPRIYEATTQLVIELHAPRYMNRRGGGEVVSLGEWRFVEHERILRDSVQNHSLPNGCRDRGETT